MARWHPNGISSSQLGINYAVSGGTYAFAREVGHPLLGFLAGSAFLGKEVIGLSVIALTFATYSAEVVPGLPIHLVAAGTMLAVTVLNAAGLDPTIRILILLTFLKVGALLVFVGAGAPEVDAENLTPVLGEGLRPSAKWRAFSWLGLLGCLSLLASLPWTALVIGAAAILALAAVRRLVL